MNENLTLESVKDEMAFFETREERIANTRAFLRNIFKALRPALNPSIVSIDIDDTGNYLTVTFSDGTVDEHNTGTLLFANFANYIISHYQK